jgi:parvulin-like peptidyl-prolyl isomerase
MSWIKKILTAPWLAFLVLGGIGYSLFPNTVEKPLIHISKSDFETYRDAWVRQNRMTTTPELDQRLLEQMVAEEALVQRALAMNLQLLPVVQDRLKKLGSFLEEDNPLPPSDEELINRAIELGLLQTDPVIRRYLVSTLERAMVASVPLDISEQEVEDYYQQHQEDYVIPSRRDILHVYFSVDDGATAATAAAAREGLASPRQTENLDAIFSRGNVFYSGHVFTGKNQQQLANIFGSEFASEVEQLQPGAWSRPLRSAYGWHLVWPDNVEPAVTPPLEDVRDKVVSRVKQGKEKELLQEQVELLKKEYDILVDRREPAGSAS